ncbi:MAG TPA: AAA domain-containing protein, partial [Flavisolibacter sp.]|nr:AAA domain-containing protein [Flavisolibacter sp.]
KRFREISKNFETLTKEELFAKLASKIPSFTQEASQTSEISILQRAIRNNGRGISLRKLFDSIPHLLPRLHPCMLMSPISVAQYFDAADTKFDLVVFDEASQMPTCEAVGAMARGSNVIVVGDPKQMPPTSFFSSNQFDEDNVEKEDLESVLDDCLALSMSSKHLLWHYRSKHESLIAFSNSKYYDNKLMTFPSPDDIDNKVKLVHVDGFYDRGKTKHNKAEAKAIVDEVLRRLSHPQSSKQSIGIVTFSSVQQILIDDMLNEAWKSHPDLEAIATNSGEPLFIKNLENVQGDERDVILFSVGYGPDKDGKVSLNFRPINRTGGCRRLNVAVSRARYEMKVFSTLKADQIDIARTASEGVAGLKAFFEYAEKGKNVLNSFHKNKNVDSTAFINILANEIRNNGYDVHTNIGCSGYRIDIGIVD